MNSVSEMKQLVNLLNYYRDEYYNKSECIVSDFEYDQLYDKLQKMENELGIVFSNSPTRTVGFTISSGLEEVKHNHPMLSQDKTKLVSDIRKMFKDHQTIIMSKMDGLTCSLKYEDGKLVSAETRGDGTVGELITHNAVAIQDIPLTIPEKGIVIVDGECIVSYKNFEKFKNEYKNPRALASGSVRLLDSKMCKERCVQFVAWRYVSDTTTKYFNEKLDKLSSYGFNVVPYIILPVNSTDDAYNSYISNIQELSENLSYPIDGCIFGFNDDEYGMSLGITSHHPRNQIAFKFYDELYETKVNSIDWTMGKTGVLTPTAIFNTVVIDGTDVSKASLHNLTVMKTLGVRKNCTAFVYKANMIIPQIDHVYDDGIEDFAIPDRCPYCNQLTEVRKDNQSEILMCTNTNCSGKLLGKLNAFVAKSGMNIDCMGEESLKYFITAYQLNNFSDIYTKLPEKFEELKRQPGWGESSVSKLRDAIEISKKVKLENFLTALSIDGVGSTTAKTISKLFSGDITKFVEAVNSGYDFASISGFGDKLSSSIHNWFANNQHEFDKLLSIITVYSEQPAVIENTGSRIYGKTFCITGTFSYSRNELQAMLEKSGGIFVSGVSKKTQVLFVGDAAGSKLKKAQELGITIVEEEDMNSWLEGIE